MVEHNESCLLNRFAEASQDPDYLRRIDVSFVQVGSREPCLMLKYESPNIRPVNDCVGNRQRVARKAVLYEFRFELELHSSNSQQM